MLLKTKLPLELLCICIGLVGCRPSKNPIKEAPVLQRVRIGHLPMISSLTHYVAKEKGFYTMHGVEVVPTEIPSSNMIAAQLLDNKIDLAIELSVVPLAKSASEKKEDAMFQIFSMSRITKTHSFDGIIVKSESPIKKLADITGKRVGVFPGTTASNTLLAEFKKIAPTLPLPMCVPIDPKLQLAAFERDSIAALYAYEATLSLAKSKYNVRLIPQSGLYSRQLDPNPIGVGAVSSKFLSANPDACKRIIDALDEAATFIEQHGAEAKTILSKSTKLQPEVCRMAEDLRMSTSKDVELKQLQLLEAELVRIGDLKIPGISRKHIYRGR